jgi:F0F1-type ATP synthase delta subunit
MQKNNLSAKNLAFKIKKLAEAGFADVAMNLAHSKEVKDFLPQIISILKRQKSKTEEFNTCKIMTSSELSSDAESSILKSINFKEGDKVQKIISKDLGVGAFVTYRGLSIDATLSTMISKSLDK